MKITIYSFLFFSFACLVTCGHEQVYDPVWQVNLKGNKKEIINQLNSNKGIKRYPFSFRKNIAWKNAPIPAYINSYLSYPDFEGDKLKRLCYTISADLKDDVALEFNMPAYEFLKNTWMDEFGEPNEEFDQSGSILLKWNLDEMMLTVTVSKQFNSYLVEYIK